MQNSPDLNHLIGVKRVVLCVGCGGVGKTTTCAALGVAAARQGKRVLCLTIDPAKRLAESLGLELVSTDAQQVAPAVFDAAGIKMDGSLTVMMLDTKTTFDNLVAALAKDPQKRDRIFNNTLYRHISTSLAGTQEYMAMEKLYELKDDPSYDLILLDTPPTSNALDFIDAPDRLASALDSAAVRWFLQVFQGGGNLSFNLLKKTAATILKGIGRITGAGFLEQVAIFVTEMNELFGGWRARADEVSAVLRGGDVAYVLVTTPDPMCVREVLFFAERLKEQGVGPDAFVVNRMPLTVGEMPSSDAIIASLKSRGLSHGRPLVDRMVEATQEFKRRAELARLQLTALDEVYASAERGAGHCVLYVPNFPRDIHDVSRLLWVANVLAPTN